MGESVAKARLSARPPLVALEGGTPPSDWGSLLADLSGGKGQEPDWRIHDRTHLELAVDFPLPEGDKRADFDWDVYFFLPDSLRVGPDTYPKRNIFDDLRSYLRFAVPRIPLEELPGEPTDRLRRALEGGDERMALRELRLFASLVRANSVRAERSILELLEVDPPDLDTASRAAMALASTCAEVTAGLREALEVAASRTPAPSSKLAKCVSSVDEDVSRVVETVLASVALKMREAGAPKKASGAVAAGAVDEARYRARVGINGTGSASSGKRDVEHLEFRRHTLKRFTSSVLWLTSDVRQAATVVQHVLYGVAAAAAMAFAIAAALWNGFNPGHGSDLWLWIAAAVIAYAGKDRIKAVLQTRFATLARRWFPDRRWHVRDDAGDRLGRVSERAAFVSMDDVPEEARAVRTATRSELDEESRPESVLWHQKKHSFHPGRVRNVDPRFEAVTEIFRLNVRRWLDHTDDPKRNIVFADPDDGRIYTATAPRVYNVAVVYRLQGPGIADSQWHRLRLVVTRKGILRVDPIY